MITAEDILQYLRNRRYRPQKAPQVAKALGISSRQMESFLGLVKDLQLKGLIVEAKKGRLCLPKHVDLVVGTLEVTRDGFGFVIPKVKDGREDVYIAREDRGTAFHGDDVVAKVTKRGDRRARSRGRRGTVVRVLKRARPFIVGTFEEGPRFCYCVPDDPRIDQDVYLDGTSAAEAQHGDKVVVQLFEWTDRHLNPEGEVVEVLGKAGDPRIDAVSVIRQHNLPDRFSRAAVREAREFGDTIPKQGQEGRLDLRSTLIVTIDPVEAHDFDDGISLERLPNGNWRLGVHIADVSYYVRPGTELDREARSRGTSVYLPGRVIPMLPQELSSQLCCLRQGTDRLAKSVFLEFGPRGKQLGYEICHSTIRSARRFTYEEVTQLLEGEAEGEDEEIVSLLRDTEQLARMLLRRRMNRGAIDLELPEVGLVLDEHGEVVDAQKRERKMSHRLIEECMLAANGAVADHCRRRKLPCMFRSHEDPSETDLHEFQDFLLSWGYALPRDPSRKDFQEFLDEIKDRPEGYPIHLEFLKSLKRAQYTPEQVAHYALAIDRYCHFTSPIRRYPDLLVHRVLDEHLAGGLVSERERDGRTREFEGLSSHCNYTERRAAEAERDLKNLKLLRYLERNRDRCFPATIVKMRHFGFFVELDEYLIQGLVHVSRLSDDFYEFDQRRQCFRGRKSKIAYSLGDRIEVTVDKIDLPRRQADFVPVPQ